MHLSKVNKLEDKVNESLSAKETYAFVDKRIDEKLELLNYRLEDLTYALKDLRDWMAKTTK